VPLAVVSLLVVFGHAVTSWLAPNLAPGVRESIYAVAVLIRWAVALGASVGLIALVYYLGVPDGHLSVPEGWARWPSRSIRGLAPREECVEMGEVAARSWRSVLPGALMATVTWFLTTLAFGWYVTTFANYSEVYGSIGAAIALLFWLYIVSLCVLCGAEFNAQFASQHRAHFGGGGDAREPEQEAKSEKAT
jgi:membrane protein